MSPVEVLRTATSGAAQALGIDAETGSLATGLAADVMVVRGNPLRDLSLLEQPSLVIARGEEVSLAR
jgi:imidazolonepropionase-like amidohydrolase